MEHQPAEMAHQRKGLATTPEDLSLTPGMHERVEGENRLHKAVLWLPHVCSCMGIYVHHVYIHVIIIIS